MRDNDLIPVIRIETRSHNMTFEADTMELIGRPRHLEFLWDDDEKMLCVVIVPKHTRYSTRLPETRKKDSLHPTKVQESHIVKALANKLGWEKGRCYEITGTYDAGKRAVYFPLSQAEDIGGWEYAF